jgi:hypothetical protein
MTCRKNKPSDFAFAGIKNDIFNQRTEKQITRFFVEQKEIS